MVNYDITDEDITRLLTHPEETTVLSLDDYVPVFNKIKNKFKDVKGLYLSNNYKPLIEFNSIYYVTIDDKLTLITSIDDIKISKSNIYRKVGDSYDIYMKYTALKKLMPKLVLNPDINYIYVLFLKELVDIIINGFLSYKPYISHIKLYSYTKEQYWDYLKNEEYISDFDQLYDDIANIVYKHRWNIYFTKIINNSILIERMVDYRIYDWTLNKVKD